MKLGDVEVRRKKRIGEESNSRRSSSQDDAEGRRRPRGVSTAKSPLSYFDLDESDEEKSDNEDVWRNPQQRSNKKQDDKRRKKKKPSRSRSRSSRKSNNSSGKSQGSTPSRRGRPPGGGGASLTPVSSTTRHVRETSPTPSTNEVQMETDDFLRPQSSMSARVNELRESPRPSVSSEISPSLGNLTLETPPSARRSKRSMVTPSPSAYLDGCSDEEITPAKRGRRSDANTNWEPPSTRKRKTDTRSYSSTDRVRLSRKKKRELLLIPLPNFKFDEPKEMALLVLPDPEECIYCIALGWWKRRRICCDNGLVFIFPPKKLPGTIKQVFTSKLPKFRKMKKNVIRLNGCLSFGSIQTTFIQSNKFGVQVTKVQGPVYHFSSCALPYDGCRPVYGNLYLFEGDEANELRHSSYSDLDKEILLSIQLFLEKNNYLAKYYKKMGDLIKEQERLYPNKKSSIRMKILDARKANDLQGPHKIYRQAKGGNHLAVFFDASVNQDIRAPGLIIYPRMGPNVMLPIFYWTDIVSPLCFVLLFPYGEYGFAYHFYKLASDRTMLYEDRLIEYAVNNYAAAQEWELNISARDLLNSVNRLPTAAQDTVGDSSDDSLVAAEEDIEEEGSNSGTRRRIMESDEEEDEDEIFEGDHASGILNDLNGCIREGEDPDDENELTVPVNAPRVYSSLQDEIAYPEQDAEETDEFLSPPAEVFEIVEKRPFAVDVEMDDFVLGNTDIRPERVEQVVVEEEPEDDDQEEDTLREYSEGIRYLDEREREQASEIGLNDGDEPMEVDEMEEEDDQGTDGTEQPPEIEEAEMVETGEIGQGDAEVPLEETREATPEEMEDLLLEEKRLPVSRSYVTRRQYMCNIYQIRDNVVNKYLAAGKLGQFYLVDQCTRLMRQRNEFIKKHYGEFRTSTKTKFLDGFQKRMDQKNIKGKIGALMTVPNNVTGSPRWLRDRFENAVALSNKLGRPDLFITATTNTQWPELKKIIPEGHTFADCPFQTNMVFKEKLDILMERITGTDKTAGLWGPTRWHTYSIEFQQRGPPHAHIIVSLVNKIKTAEDLRKVSQAEIPVRPGRLRDLVEEFMIHRPCEGDKMAYCRQGCKATGLCTKGFPKKFSETCRLDELNYAQLYRPSNMETSSRNDNADNRHVVPYNTQLLTLWGGHINVEVISSILVVKYIFKYLFKGVDRVLVEISTEGSTIDPDAMTVDGILIFPKNLKVPKGAIEMRKKEATELLQKLKIPLIDTQGNPTLVYNEMWWTEDMRAITANEAAWIMAKYERAACSHSVVEIGVHLPKEEPISFPAGTERAVKQRLEFEEMVTMFNAWFKLNQEDVAARIYTLPELPESYRYDNGEWKKRKRFLKVIGKLKSVPPRNRELFAIRLLATNIAGPQSFEDLKTVDGKTYLTAIEAARALGFMDDQQEWDCCLTEAATYVLPKSLRRLFASILTNSPVSNALELYTNHREEFFEKKKSWSEERLEAHALYHIRSILRVHSKTLEQFGLPPVIDEHLPPLDELKDDSGSRNYSQKRSAYEANLLRKDMTEEQESVFQTLFDNVKMIINERMTYFLQGSGGTGKTRVLKALYHQLRAEGFTVACVAHTGIAASLLPMGSTAHRLFKIPLTTEDGMECSIAMGSDDEQGLKDLNCVIWDEATMTDKRIFEAVNRLFCAMYQSRSNRPFAAVPFVLAGDWKQTLPIVSGIRGDTIFKYTAQGLEFWKDIKKLQLTRNMRAKNYPEWAAFLADLGEGNLNEKQDTHLPEDQTVKIPMDRYRCNEESVIQEVYGEKGSAVEKLAIFEKSAILTVTNETAFDVNKKVLELLDEEKATFKARDSYFDNNQGLKALDPEVYNTQTPSGYPPYELEVKVGAVVSLLWNMNVAKSLTNGTRLIVTKIVAHTITCEPMNRQRHQPREVVIVPMEFTPVELKFRNFAFARFQFPIRLAFAMTCNKAQGQTIPRCGVILRTPCFAHGQLYVAFSRVEAPENLWIYNSARDRTRTQNVVYKKVLHYQSADPLPLEPPRRRDETILDFVEPDSDDSSHGEVSELDEMDPVHRRTMEGLQGGIGNAMEIEPAEEIEEGPQLFIEREVVNLGVDVVVNAVKQDFTMDSMDNKELSMACGQKLDQRVNQIKRTVLNGRDLDIAYVVCTPAFDFEEIQEIFHVAMPEVAQGSQPTPTDEDLLRKCYLNCLIKLQYKKLTSIAFPLPQNYDWQQAAMVALLLVLEYFRKNPAFWKKMKQVSFYTENGDIYRGLKIVIVETDEMTLTEGNMARLKSRLEELLLEAKKAQVITEPEEDPVIYEDPDVNFPKLHAVKGQIQLMQADVLVNAANKELRPGDGVDKAIRTACGPQITKATSEIAKNLHLKILQPGQVVSTDSYKLKTAKRIYHTAGPIVPGGTLPTLDHKKHLEKCYANALVQAELDGLRSIAFPLLSVGIYNFELSEGIWIAVWTILRHFEKNERSKIKEVIIVNQSQRIIDKIGNLLGNTTAVLNPAQVPRFRKILEKKRNQEFRCALRIAMKPNTYTTATVKARKVPPPPIYKNYRRCLAIRDCPTVGVVLELLFLIWREKVVDNVSSNCTMEALEDIFGRHPGSELVPRSMLLQIMPLSTESESASDYFFRLLQSLPFEFYEKFTFDVKVIQECEKCRTKSNTKSSLRFLTITETGSTFQETLKHVTYKKRSSNGRCTKCSKLRPFGNHQHILIPDQCEYLAVKVDLTEQNKKYRVPFPQPTVTYKETSWRLIAIIRQLDEEFGEYDIFRRMDGRDGWLHIHLTKTKVLDKNPQISNKALLVFKRNSPSK